MGVAPAEIREHRQGIPFRTNLFPIFTAVIACGWERSQLFTQALFVSSHDMTLWPFMRTSIVFQGARGEIDELFFFIQFVTRC